MNQENTNIIDVDDLRVTKLREYLVQVISDLNPYLQQINVDMLSNETDNYSIDKIPTESVVEKWVIGTEIHQDLYSFRSRCDYSQDTINNLLNIGFFEVFEEKIKNNNSEGILPDIDGIESIECANCGTMVKAETNTAEFDIQIRIKYILE